MLAATWMVLRRTWTSSFGSSTMTLRLSSTSRLSVSLSLDGRAGVPKASARNSAPHRRSSGSDDGLMMGRMPWRMTG